MIIAYIGGGIGNQLYIYAAAYTLSRKFGQELRLLILDRERYSHTYSLDELEVPDYKKIVVKSIRAAKELPARYEKEGKKLFTITEDNFADVTSGVFEEYDVVFLSGNFQRERYHKEYFHEIKPMMRLRRPSVFVEEFQRILRKSNGSGCAVHIRRSDFVYLRHTQDNYRMIFDREYYKAAVKYIEQREPGCAFMVFSDDIRYAKELLGNRENLYYVNGYGGPETDVEELLCMSMCRHKILTNGSSYGRIADKLSAGQEEGVTLYYSYEEEKDQRKDKFVYLSIKTIRELSALYELDGDDEKERDFEDEWSRLQKSAPEEGIRGICRLFLNSSHLDGERLNRLLFLKARLHYETEDYGKAELCMIKLWQYYYGKPEFHKLYFEILLREGKEMESVLEAVMYRRLTGKDAAELSRCYTAGRQSLYNALAGCERRNFIFCPYSYHISYFRNLFEIMAFALKRMGCGVTFLYREAPDENTIILPGYDKLYNYILRNNYFASNGLNYNYHYMQYDWNRVTAQEDIRDFLYHICLDTKYRNVIVSHVPELILDRRSDVNAEFVFWDFSDPCDLDTEVWNRSGERADTERLFEKADAYVTQDAAFAAPMPDKLRRLSWRQESYYETDRALPIPEVFGISGECMQAVRCLLNV